MMTGVKVNLVSSDYGCESDNSCDSDGGVMLMVVRVMVRGTVQAGTMTMMMSEDNECDSEGAGD